MCKCFNWFLIFLYDFLFKGDLIFYLNKFISFIFKGCCVVSFELVERFWKWIWKYKKVNGNDNNNDK